MPRIEVGIHAVCTLRARCPCLSPLRRSVPIKLALVASWVSYLRSRAFEIWVIMRLGLFVITDMRAILIRSRLIHSKRWEKYFAAALPLFATHFRWYLSRPSLTWPSLIRHSEPVSGELRQAMQGSVVNVARVSGRGGQHGGEGQRQVRKDRHNWISLRRPFI